MTGMDLSRRFWREVLEPALIRDFPSLYSRIAAGLAGNGSECFGFDDVLSQDHDWGTEVFLWLPDTEEVPRLIRWKQSLLDAHPEFPQHSRVYTQADNSVLTCGQFYRQLLGDEKGPQTVRDWFTVPEENLAMAVNGEVFYDGLGQFTAVREYLLSGRPEALRRKRIAARCMMLAQTGQYNLERCVKRGQFVTASTVCGKFVEEAVWLVFLLNRVYKPYYKWEFPAMLRLPRLADIIGPLLQKFTALGGWEDAVCQKRQEYADQICAIFADALREDGLSDSEDSFLAAHGQAVQASIEDPLLSRLPPQVG
ncbi:MAG: DUF4037 domain-containing protein [Oscillospiraceae bacterium]|nr:DUF4037 domain-containing protein [Oscillospiraceae bacterium]